jgi:hypothetical protein
VYLWLLSIAFSVWMLVDAIRRRADFFWLPIILLFQPIGPLAYFFVVKIHDFDLGALGRALGAGPRRPDVRELRQRVEETPSVANRLALGEALEESEDHAAAADLFRAVLFNDPNNKQALHGLGRSLRGLDRPGEAVEHYAKLAELDAAYRDHSAALEYAEALWESGQNRDAIEVLEAMAASSTRLNHRVALGHYLSRSGETARAREVLESGLRHYETSPAFVRRRDRRWASEAEKLLRALAREQRE